MTDGKLDREALLTYIFSRCDDNNSGSLTMKEYAQLNPTMDDEAVFKHLTEIFRRMDVDNNERVSIKEWKDYNLKEGESSSDDEFYNYASYWLQLARSRNITDKE